MGENSMSVVCAMVAREEQAAPRRRTVNRSEVLAHRIYVQQLDRGEARREMTDAAVFDFGIQDTGRDGASWALANRGVPISDAAELEASPDVTLVWTLRAAPHYYRRSDLAEILVATSPLSDKDAAKRVIGADKPLKAAGIPPLAGLAEVATQMRHVVTGPLVKGEVSTQLTARLDPPYLRYCGACKATHSWEVPFRISALYAGLELEPGTSPPVLRRIPAGRGVRRDPHPTHWPRRRHCNQSGITSDSSVQQRQMMSQPSWTRPSPRSRRIGRRM
jgi:hypothetical protein